MNSKDKASGLYAFYEQYVGAYEMQLLQHHVSHSKKSAIDMRTIVNGLDIECEGIPVVEHLFSLF